MHRTYYVVETLGASRVQVLLYAAEHTYPAAVLFPEHGYFPAVFLGFAGAQTVTGVKGRVAVGGKAYGVQASAYRRKDYFFRRVRPVAVPCVYVKIVKAHCVIFSCFTLWSMTWREESSLWISSRDIPASIISTRR